MALILVDPRSGRRQAIGLDATPLRVGSAVDCDVVLPDASVAPHALTFTWGTDGVVVEATGKGTFLLNEAKTTASRDVSHAECAIRAAPSSGAYSMPW